MLEKAMELSPLDEEIYGLYRQVRGGGVYKAHSDDDWFIRVCEPNAEKYPQNIQLIVMLVETMIRMRYFEKAEKYIDLMHLDDSRECLRRIYLGDLELARGNMTGAKTMWDAISEDDSCGQYESSSIRWHQTTMSMTATQWNGREGRFVNYRSFEGIAHWGGDIFGYSLFYAADKNFMGILL